MAVVNFRFAASPYVRLVASVRARPSFKSARLLFGGQVQGWKTKASNVTKKGARVYNFFRPPGRA